MDSEPIPESINELSILFTNDNKIKELNAQFRSKDKPTDVLSFSQLEGEEELTENTMLGDIVISLDTAERQAEELKHSFDAELLRLLIHGILHLFGYDHENVSEEEAQKMEALEDDLFNKYNN